MNIDDALTTRIIFHPRPEEAGYVSKGIPTETKSEDAIIGGCLHPAQNSDALIVFFHGNGEIAADYDELASVYVESGASFWVVDYRGYGRSTGFPSYSRMFSDAEAVAKDIPRIAALANRSFSRVFVMGRSLGSASAIFLAAVHSHRFHGLLLDSPFSNGLKLINRLGGPKLKETDMCGVVNNIDRMASCTLPTLIIHGTDDYIIPISDAEELLIACKSEQKKLVKIRGAGHNDLLFRGFSIYCAELRGFIAQLTSER
jgi:alpha-beta hydrolase superfamily lysophospholipase